MLSRFRAGFYGGLILALFVGVFLIWLWQPERQVERHTENFLHAIEQKNWKQADEQCLRAGKVLENEAAAIEAVAAELEK